MNGRTRRAIAIVLALLAMAGLIAAMLPTAAVAATSSDKETIWISMQTNMPYQEAAPGQAIKPVHFFVYSNSRTQILFSLSVNMPDAQYRKHSYNDRSVSVTVPQDAQVGTMYTVLATANVENSTAYATANIKVVKPETPPQPPAPEKSATFIDTANFQSCAVTPEGRVKCWGRNGDGQLGAPANNPAFYPTPHTVPNLTDVKEVSTGNLFSCALKKDNTVWCWGNNTYNQLGTSSKTLASSDVPKQVGGLSNAGTLTSITSGTNHSCVLNSAGTAYCWGSNSKGQLGTGTMGWDFSRAMQVSVVSAPIKQLALGASHTCALMKTGSVYCWGDDEQFQLGDAYDFLGAYPQGGQVSGTYKAISSKYDFTCGITTANKVACWGSNNHGQLGIGKDPYYFPYAKTPQTISGLSSVKQLATGYYHACAVTDSNAVYCWGRASSHQLPKLDTQMRTSPVNTNLGTTAGTIEQLSLGAAHSCLLNTKGDVYCWGNQTFGQLGDGTTIAVQSDTLHTTNQPQKVHFK